MLDLNYPRSIKEIRGFIDLRNCWLIVFIYFCSTYCLASPTTVVMVLLCAPEKF